MFQNRQKVFRIVSKCLKMSKMSQMSQISQRSTSDVVRMDLFLFFLITYSIFVAKLFTSLSSVRFMPCDYILRFSGRCPRLDDIWLKSLVPYWNTFSNAWARQHCVHVHVKIVCIMACMLLLAQAGPYQARLTSPMSSGITISGVNFLFTPSSNFNRVGDKLLVRFAYLYYHS